MQPILTTEHGCLYKGDCLDVLATLEDESADLVFADPPFNLGKDYGKGVSDSLKDADYLDWCSSWLKECARITAPGGAVWLYNLPKWNIELGHMLNGIGLTFRHWVSVAMTNGLPIAGRLYPSHYSLLYYTKGKPKHFERSRVPIATCRHCGGEIKDYGGHRKKMHPEGVNLSDVWTDIAPVRHAKTKHRRANALPEKLLERVLTISSAEGDLVVDPFGGSGTTFAVAERMHRRWLGIELGDCDAIVARLAGDGKIEGYMPNKGDAGKKAERQQEPLTRGPTTTAPDRLFPS